MFDIGFWEISLICLVALLVVGPERFPGLVRGAGYWLGRFRQMASSMKDEFQTELDKAEQLKGLMNEQEDIMKRHILPADDEPASKDEPSPDKARPVPASVAKSSTSTKLVDDSEATGSRQTEKRPE